MIENISIQDLFDEVVLKPGERFPRLRSDKTSHDLAHLRRMFCSADVMVREFARHGFRIKVAKGEVTICSPRHPHLAFYARPAERGDLVSFNFHPTKDARVPHLRLSSPESVVADEYFCFHRQLPEDIKAFLALVRKAEESL
jgi:hypothetical protein